MKNIHHTLKLKFSRIVAILTMVAPSILMVVQRVLDDAAADATAGYRVVEEWSRGSRRADLYQGLVTRERQLLATVTHVR